MAATGGLNETELAMLSTLAYLVEYEDIKPVGTVKEFVESAMRYMETHNIDGDGMTDEDWVKFLERVEKHEKLLSYRIVDVNYPDKDTEFSALTVKSGDDVAIVYRGTAGNYGWSDNGYAMYSENSAQQRQAKTYAEKIIERFGDSCYYTTTGHSKGGNLAQYAALEIARINACFAYDGQGFSYEYYQKLKENYSDAELEALFARITVISAGHIENGVVTIGDIVNEIGKYVSGERYYVNVGDLGNDPFKYHYPNYLVMALDDGAETATFSKIGQIVQLLTLKLSMDAEGQNFILVEALADVIMIVAGVLTSGLNLKNIMMAIEKAYEMKYTELKYLLSSIVGKITSMTKIIWEKMVSAGKEVVATVVSTLASAVKVIETAIKHSIEVVKSTIDTVINIVKETATRVAVKVGNWVVTVKNKVVNVLTSWKNSITNMVKKAIITGAQYAATHPLVVVDTSLLYKHAGKLTEINRLLSQIDSELNGLYSKVGLDDILKLVHADLHTHHSAKLSQCRNYMEETANQFEQIESFLALFV